jgi:hypothetical protein
MPANIDRLLGPLNQYTLLLEIFFNDVDIL